MTLRRIVNESNEHQIKNLVRLFRATNSLIQTERTEHNIARLKRLKRIINKLQYKRIVNLILIIGCVVLSVVNSYILMGGKFDKVKVEPIPHYYNE